MGKDLLLNMEDARPLYKQISEDMLSRIASGEWKVDEQIPTEPELCETYGVSRMTIRLALDELCNRSIIYRKQGKGTFVSQPRINQQLSSFYSFTTLHGENGYYIKKKITDWKIIKAGKDASGYLHIDSEDSVFYIERVLYCNNVPFAVEASHIPVNFCPKLTKEKIDKNGLYYMLEQYDIRPNAASEMFESILLPPRYQKLLEAQPPAPGFLIYRVSQHDNLFVEYCKSIVNGKLVKYNISLH